MATLPPDEWGSVERAATGVDGLDEALSGGFPRGSLVLVSGNPGTGKTILTSTFLYHGAKDGEKGVYVSFSEGKRSFYENMKTVHMNFEALEKQGKFQFLEMLTFTAEGMTKNIWEVLEMVRKMGAQRLVIDSYSVMSQALDDSYKARQVLHTVLSKVVRKLECTTLVIGEQPSGESRMSDGAGEFVADGVIVLKLSSPRELEVRKMRGTKLVHRNLTFTIERGFDVLTTQIRSPARARPWEPIPDNGRLLSSGSPDLDAILGGGFPRGTYLLLETSTDVEVEDIRLMARATGLNFISQDRGAMVLPTAGLEAKDIRTSYERYVAPETFSKFIRVTEQEKIRTLRGEKSPVPPWVVQLKGPHAIDTTLAQMFSAIDDLKKVTEGKPVFRSIGYDTLESLYPSEPEKMFEAVGLEMMRTKGGGDLSYAIARPSFYILNKARDLVEWHFMMTRKNGLLMLQGIKPRTALYGVDCDVSRGYPFMKLRLLT